RPLPLLPLLEGRSEHPVRVDRRAHLGDPERPPPGAPDRGARARARPPRGRLRGPAERRAAPAVWRPAEPLADGLPVRRGAQVLLRLLVPHRLVQQDPVVWSVARGRRLSRGLRGRLPALAPRGRAGARGARAALGVGWPGARADALAADRRSPQ